MPETPAAEPEPEVSVESVFGETPAATDEASEKDPQAI